MQAIQYTAFGNSEVIHVVELPQPEIKTADDVLIQVKAASVNPLDMKIRMGFMQQMRPVTLPFVPGLDASGIVVAVGKDVTQFKAGDEVLAVTMANGYAEYVVANQHFVLHKPANLSFVEATSLAVNLGTAQSILFTEGKLTAGQKVLIQGAAGAVGATMVQLAKNNGLYVIATASGNGIDLVKSLGADEVYDYKTQDVTKEVSNLDLVADCAGGDSLQKLFVVLKKGGKMLSIAGMPSPELAQQHEVEARFVSSNLTAQNIAPTLDLVKAGKIQPIIAKIFTLAEAAQAQDFLSTGSTNGKVVLEIA